MKKCTFCKKELIGKQKSFCSVNCSGKFSKKENLKKWEGRKNGKFVKCNFCNKEVYKYPRDLKRNKTNRFFCGSKCRYIGFSITKEIREKISKTLTGRFRGKENPNWKGGSEKSHRKGFVPHLYNEWKKAVLKRDKYTCQICKIYGKKLVADHIKPWHFYPELRYVVFNGRVLCDDCHKKTDTYGSRIKNYKKTA